MKISRSEFLRYEKVRQSGRWNMFTDALAAMHEACLNRATYIEIIRNYEKLRNRYMPKEKVS